jgi:hypothetical protein
MAAIVKQTAGPSQASSAPPMAGPTMRVRLKRADQLLDEDGHDRPGHGVADTGDDRDREDQPDRGDAEPDGRGQTVAARLAAAATAPTWPVGLASAGAAIGYRSNRAAVRGKSPARPRGAAPTLRAAPDVGLLAGADHDVQGRGERPRERQRSRR